MWYILVGDNGCKNVLPVCCRNDLNKYFRNAAEESAAFVVIKLLLAYGTNQMISWNYHMHYGKMKVVEKLKYGVK